MITPEIHFHQHDLPTSLPINDSVAIDTEAMGLNPHRDRLCLVQLSTGNGVCHLVKIAAQQQQNSAPNLTRLLTDSHILKIFHFARFDVGILQHTFNITIPSIYCTKIASKLVRTFIDRHGLRDLCRDLLGIEISKEQQTSDWGKSDYTLEQQQYAATDVLYLHQLKAKLDGMLVREGRQELAQALFDFIPTCAKLDIMGYDDLNVLKH